MRGLLSGSHDHDDGAIDAPPAIGIDERRMSFLLAWDREPRRSPPRGAKLTES